MKSFDELPLSEPVRRAIDDLGFEVPSPIQAQTLPLLLEKPTDYIGLAATGTGKTAAFGVPMLEQVDASKNETQFLVMCPTRELALQVTGQINLLGRHLDVRALPVYGGSQYSSQIRGLREGAQIVVGTPGRLIDHLERGNLKLENVKTIVLDEADEMISMGFKDELEKILQSVKRDKTRIWLFSATMNKEVRRVASTYLKKPVQVQVNQKKMLSGTVEQFFYPSKESDKAEVLCKIIENVDELYGLIFCQTKSLVADLANFLAMRGYKVDSLHGDKDQRSREKTMQAFRDKKVQMLVCTDVASRGLDVKDLTHVINYSIPRELDSYVHRIGRTARGGKSGIAISLVTPSQRSLVKRIEAMTKTQVKECKVPSRREIGTKKISKVLEKFLNQKHQFRAIELLQDDWKEAISNMPGEEIVGRFLSLSNPELFDDTKRAKMVLGPYAGSSQSSDEGSSRNRKRRERKPRERNSNSRRKPRKAGEGSSSSRSRGQNFKKRSTKTAGSSSQGDLSHS